MRLLLLLAASCLLAQAPAPPDPFAVANTFAAAYREWGTAYQARVATIGVGGYSAAEKRAFDRVQERFADLRRYMHAQYQ